MKKKVIALSVAIILVVAFCLFYFLVLKNKRNLTITTGVNVVPTMNDKITSDSAWCGTFQLVWNDMVKEAKLKTNSTYLDNSFVSNLNKMDFDTSMISDEYYYKTYGLKTLELKKKIEKDIKNNFNQSSDILDSFSWSSDDVSSDNYKRYFFYTMLYREFEYNKRFSILDNDKFGNYDDVKYFGTISDSSSEAREQIEVLFYDDRDNFAVKLHTKNGDEVIFYKNAIGDTFNEIYDNLNSKTASYKGNRNFGENDFFKAPFMDFNVKKEYDELYNVSFISDEGTEYAIDMALQTISFSLDEKGGRVKSEAATDMKTTSIGDREFRYFYVNDDFTLFLKEEKRDKPYLAIKVSDISKYQS